MRILLPPSEGKTPPPEGPPLDLDALSFPGLNPTRRLVLDALVELCAADPVGALSRLGLGPSLLPEVHRNAALPAQPCGPAARIYSGVLHTALGIGSLPDSAQRTAAQSVLIASGLFGLVRPDDPIPAYRLSGGVRLPGLPTPRRVWSSALAEVLRPLAQQHLIIDMRSGVYSALFGQRTPRWVPVRVVTIRDGRRVSVSHHNKATRGAIARSLLTAGHDPEHPVELAQILRADGWSTHVTADNSLEVVLQSSPAPQH